jgi:FkbM family methyltransferase
MTTLSRGETNNMVSAPSVITTRAPGVLTRNQDVFQICQSQVGASANIAFSEKCNAGSIPVQMEAGLLPADASVSCDIEWNAVSPARQRNGDVVDFTVSVSDIKGSTPTVVLIFRFPLHPRAAADRHFATVGAASILPEQKTAIAGFEIGFGASGKLAFKVPTVARFDQFFHMATGWKFDSSAKNLFFEVRVHVATKVSAAKFRVGRVFAGNDYDPYVFNPAFEYRAYLHGGPEIPRARDACAAFENAARAEFEKHKFAAMQAFIKPFVVMREGNPAFPMLIGTPNSISWYAIDPFHHSEFFRDLGYVRPGDVALDCGAHAGQMTTLFGQIAGETGKVFAFEPFPQNYLQVEAQKELNNQPNMVSTRAGVGPQKATISLASRAQTVDTRLPGKSDEEKLEAQILPLDDFIDVNPTFIKLDVEGAEVGALQGAQKLLTRCKPRILAELHQHLMPDFGHTVTQFFEAIPQSIYDIRVQFPGETAMHPYESGMELARQHKGGLVWAVPK